MIATSNEKRRETRRVRRMLAAFLAVSLALGIGGVILAATDPPLAEVTVWVNVPTLTVSPNQVQRGSTFTLSGRWFDVHPNILLRFTDLAGVQFRAQTITAKGGKFTLTTGTDASTPARFTITAYDATTGVALVSVGL